MWPYTRRRLRRGRRRWMDCDPGILENRKANARLLMETMVERLGERFDLGEMVVGSKPVGAPPSDSTIEALRNGADFLLIGSCD